MSLHPLARIQTKLPSRVGVILMACVSLHMPCCHLHTAEPVLLLAILALSLQALLFWD